MQKTFYYIQSTISYTIHGNGQPVILLHGFGEDSSIWNGQIDFLKNHCTLIIPDLLGSGKSEILNSETVEITDFANCINALLEQENIEKCILLGHSMGGYITLAFAEMFPQKLKAFGLVHSTAFADSAEKKTGRQQGIEMINEYGAFAFLKNTIPNLFSKKFKETNADEVEQLIEKGKNFSAEALTQYYTTMMNRPDRTVVLKDAKVPVLFIIGEEDVAAPLDDLLQQVPLPDISDIHILQGVGHMGMMEVPELLNKHLLSFIDSIHK